MEYFIIIFLIIVILILGTKYFLLKRQLKSVINQLDLENTKLVTTQLVDADLNTVVVRINALLDKIQQTIIGERKSSAALKSSIVNISHDMKTPLTSVIGYLQLAKKECENKEIKEMLQICLERTKYCNSLINNFFELSMIDINGCKANIEKIDVAAEICEQILSVIPQFDKKGITPYFENSDKTVFANADKLMFRRIMQNLITNAIRYASGNVVFSIIQNDNITINVSNPIESFVDTEHIFDRFYMQDKSRNSGSGIGLYLCKEFAEAMGGSISANINNHTLNITLQLEKVDDM